MGLETATYISGLVSTNPVGATDPKSQGDDHIRLIKATLLATFPSITGAVTLTHSQINDAARKGAANTFTAGNTFSAAITYGGVTLSNSVTGTGSMVLSASPTLTGTLSAAAGTFSSTLGVTGAATFSSALTLNTTTTLTGSLNSTNASGGYLRLERDGSGFGYIGNDSAVEAGTLDDFGIYATQKLVLVAAGGTMAFNAATLLDFNGPADFSSTVTAAGVLKLAATTVIQQFNETDAATNEQNWILYTGGGVLHFATASDASPTSAVKDAIYFDRSGTTVSTIQIGNATDIPDINVYGAVNAITSLAVNSVPVATRATSSFTGTLTGCTTSPTATFYYTRAGNLVTVWLESALEATSNATTMTLTGLPAAIQPASTQRCATTYATKDNSTTPFFAEVVVTAASGTVTFNKSGVSSNWTNSGTKGLASGLSFTYSLD